MSLISWHNLQKTGCIYWSFLIISKSQRSVTRHIGAILNSLFGQKSLSSVVEENVGLLFYGADLFSSLIAHSSVPIGTVVILFEFSLFIISSTYKSLALIFQPQEIHIMVIVNFMEIQSNSLKCSSGFSFSKFHVIF